MKDTKNIRNGSLYFNTNTSRVERVRGKANSSSVFTTVHGDELNCVRSKSLQLASAAQWQGYLDAPVAGSVGV